MKKQIKTIKNYLFDNTGSTSKTNVLYNHHLKVKNIPFYQKPVPLNKKHLKKFNKQFRHNKEIYIIADNIQYARNVASIFRIADAMGAQEIILTGISKTPPFGKELAKVSRHKEKRLKWRYFKSTSKAIDYLNRKDVPIIAIEQVSGAVPYYLLKYPNKFALMVGNEAYGIPKSTISRLKNFVVIPMFGKGASLNVHVSLAVVGFYAII